MKIPILAFCDSCFEEAKKQGKKYLEDTMPPIKLVELNATGIYSFNCPNQHENWIFLQQHLFQVLFDSGALALCDGYTREATTNFATSLERFYEFVIKLLLISNNIQEDIIEKYWKQLAKKSERQFGAFLSLFIQKFNQMPPIPERKWEEFRNDIIHKGIIPNEKEGFNYGENVYGIIMDSLIILKDFYKNDINQLINKVFRYELSISKRPFKEIRNPGTGSIVSIIPLKLVSSEIFKKNQFAHEVEKYRKHRKLKVAYALQYKRE